MRILHTSDWHLGRNLEQISRIDEQREFIDELCGIAEEQDVDLILVAGDIYDTYNPSAAAEELFYYAIDRLNDKGKRAVVVIAGNHDNPERLCAASPLAVKNGIILLGYPGSDARSQVFNIKDTETEVGQEIRGEDFIKIIDSGPGWLELHIQSCEHHAVIITMPYPSESRLEEVLVKEADEGLLQKAYSDKVGGIFMNLAGKFRQDTVNLAVGHLFLRGGRETESERTLQIGGALTVDPAGLPANAHFVALGHLHRPQEIKEAPCPTFYAGSPLAYSFSEAEHGKAVYLIDVNPGEVEGEGDGEGRGEGKKAEITPIYLNCGKPLRRWVAEKGIEQALQWCEEGRDQNAWIDLEIVTDRVLTVEEQKRLRALNPGIINIRPRITSEAAEVTAPESREGQKIDVLFKDYFKYRTGTEISDELMNAFIDVISEESEESEDEDRNEDESEDEVGQDEA